MNRITPNKVYAHADRIAAWQAGGKPAPVTVEWDLSNRCPLGCRFCHMAHTHVRGPWVSRERDVPEDFDSPGDMAAMSVVIRGLSEMADAGVKGIIWSGGGEPTTHPEWQSAVEHAAANGLSQGMYTLGGLLTPNSAEILARNLAWVVVSLDAASPETYAAEKGVPESRFEAAVSGVRYLTSCRSKHHAATIGVSFLLHAGNWAESETMLALARELGAEYTTFRPAIQTSPADPATCTEDRSWITDAMGMLTHLSAYDDVECDPARFAAYRDWAGRSYGTCYGVRMNATVTPDGRVWLCPQHRGMPGSCIGDLRQDSFADIWESHPGEQVEFSRCRVMCRLHLVNEALDAAFSPYQHPEFI